MKRRTSDPNRTHAIAGPIRGRWLLIALCALILCSCRSPVARRTPLADDQAHGDSLPAEAYTGGPAGRRPMGPPGMEAGVPLPYTPRGPWSPPGIRQPWPEDEYLRDGGDEGLPDRRGEPAGEVMGLEMEDAVAHYDTLDGRTLVEPSNEVYIYSPRFGAVRQVVGLVANEERQRAGGVYVPEKIDAPTTLQLVADTKQNIQLGDEIAARPPVALRSKQAKDVMSTAIGPRAFQNAFKPYENLAIIRRACSRRPRCRSWPAAPTRPSPGRTPRPCRSCSNARARWPR